MTDILAAADQLIRLNQRYHKRLLPSTAWALGQLLCHHDYPDLMEISRHLCSQHGPAFRARYLRRMQQLYASFPDSSHIRNELSWSHYQLLMRVKPLPPRIFYLREAADNQWSCAILRRQIKAQYYERLQWASHSPAIPHYVLEFARPHLPGPQYQEKDLEVALIQRMQALLLELGTGFAFVARQKRISTSYGKPFTIDLVFYHYHLRCFVLIDLKRRPLDHRAIAQMDMYVRIYDDTQVKPEDNPTIGIILCPQKDRTLARYSILQQSDQVFASTYQLFLPTEEELAHYLHQNMEL